jgi:hypothetical protein
LLDVNNHMNYILENNNITNINNINNNINNINNEFFISPINYYKLTKELILSIVHIFIKLYE